MVIITTENIDIIIPGSVEQVIKELRKIKPVAVEMAKTASKIMSDEINKVSFKVLEDKARSTIQNVKS